MLTREMMRLNRRITDNILLAHELVRDCHKNKGDYCALKVYLQKAYNSVS